MILRKLLLGLVFFAVAAPAEAHPHIFIDARAALVFDASGALAAIHHTWTFDEAFSAWSIQGLDTDNDGVVTSAEMQELADQDMEGLGEYNYYTYAGEGDLNLAFAKGSEATLAYANNLTTLTFATAVTPPYHIRQELQLAINDPEYYVAITFAGPGAVTMENAPAGCTSRLEPPRDMPDELSDQLAALGPDVVQLPPALAAAMRGVQGAIVIDCPDTGAAPAATAVEAAGIVANAKPIPFNGPPKEPGLPVVRTGLLGWVFDMQRDFYAAMSEALGRVRADNNAFWLLGGLSFLYGVFHAAGPGHGKVVISSYVLANERQLRRGVLLSFLSAMLQSSVAVVLVLIAAVALRLTSAAVSSAANWIGIASYGMVALLGAWLIVRHLFFGHRHTHAPAPVDAREKARAALHHHDHGHDHNHNHNHDHDHDHDHHHGHGHNHDDPDAHGHYDHDLHAYAPGHDHGHDHDGHDHGHDHDGHDHVHVVTADKAGGSWREQVAVVVGVGLRPCSGALVVLAFALTQDVVPAGIAAVFLMGLGTAITVAVLATIAATAKGFALRFAGSGGGTAASVLWWLELAGAIGVLAFGLLLLFASF